jgi:hypothetical protein
LFLLLRKLGFQSRDLACGGVRRGQRLCRVGAPTNPERYREDDMQCESHIPHCLLNEKSLQDRAWTRDDRRMRATVISQNRRLTACIL